MDKHFSRITSQKLKSSRNRFCLFIWGPGRRLRWHGVSIVITTRTQVSVVNDCADTREMILFWKKEINNKKVIWYFRKLLVRVFIDYMQTPCQRSRWLRRHVLKYSTTMRTQCQRCRRSQQLCGHDKDYADTFWNLEGFSQILKEQSGEKRYLSVFTHTIARIWKYENYHIYWKFAIEYLRKNEKVRQTVFAFSYWA